jgi:hypothetical protein
MAGLLKQEKLSLSTSIDELEAIAEFRRLTTQELDLKNQYNAKLAGLLCEEELKWYQRSKAQFLLEGARIQDTFIVSLMAGTERNVFIP